MSASATAKDYQHMLGLMASCIELIPFTRLYMRPIQVHLLHFWKPVSRDLEAKITGSQHLKEHLNWWLQPVNMHKGRSLQPVQANLTIATNSSGLVRGVKQSVCSRNLVTRTKEMAQKLSGVRGCTLNLEEFPSQTEKSVF